jgi:LysR family transcriptional regulator, mexEF-oprN operon transcriptional activator
MNHFDLRRIDLNLLVTFDALMAERSVTRASERLGLGQPAVSHALRRLRELIGDNLFVPTRDGLVPTRRALSLGAWVRSVLEQAQQALLEPASFKPAEWTETVRIAMTPTSDMVLMPRLLAQLAERAPKLKVEVHAVPEWRDILDRLDRGALDLYIGVIRDLKAHHRQRTLWEEGFLAAFSPMQLNLRTPLSLADYLAHPHVLAATREETMEGRVDRALARNRKQRRIVLSTPHYLVIPHLLLETPLIATLHSRPARWLAAKFKLKTSPLPIKIESFTESIVWHEIVDRDPAQLWLRETILEVAGGR